MAIDRYIQRTMMETLTLIKKPRHFLLDTFFPSEKIFNTLVVDMDFVKFHNRKAAYVRRKANGQAVDATGYTTKEMRPPYMKPYISTDADEDLAKAPGEVIYSSGSPETRAAAKIAKDTMELDGMMSVAEEYQATQALFYDSVDIQDEDGNDIVSAISYDRTATHDISLLAAAARWTAGTSDPIGNLRDWDQLIQDDGKVNATDVILGKTALAAFLANTDVRALMDNKKMYMTDEISMIKKEFGVKWVGHVEGLDIWYYSGTYWNGSANVQYVPAKYCLVGSRDSSGTRLYGAIRHLKAGTRAAKRFPWNYTNEAEDERFVQIHSAPLVFPANPDAFVSAQVVA